MSNINTFKNSKKLVIKIGSSLLTNSAGGINKSTLKNVVQDIVWLLKKNKEVVLRTSVWCADNTYSRLLVEDFLSSKIKQKFSEISMLDNLSYNQSTSVFQCVIACKKINKNAG